MFGTPGEPKSGRDPSGAAPRHPWPTFGTPSEPKLGRSPWASPRRHPQPTFGTPREPGGRTAPNHAQRRPTTETSRRLGPIGDDVSVTNGERPEGLLPPWQP